jgi:lipopolysaccharide export system permease protein
VKIIDRYILREFILPYLYCNLAFLMLYVVGDLFEHMDEFLKARTGWQDILSYYLYMIPTIFTHTAPFSLVLSLIYELGNFARHSEIIGMKACGISPKRIAIPFLFLGLTLSLVFLYLSERVIPKANVELEILAKTYFQKSTAQNSKPYEDLAYSNAKDNYVFYIRKLDLNDNSAQEIQIQYLTPQGTIQKLIRAEAGRWLDGEWWLFNGTVLRYDETGDLQDDAENFIKRMVRIQESPQDLIREEKANQKMNYSELKDSFLKKFGKIIPAFQLVELHSKLSSPWICFILVLMIVPIGLKIPKGGAFVVLGKTILLTLGFYGSQFISMALGKQGYLQPVFACWLPNLIFGSFGVILLGKLK